MKQFPVYDPKQDVTCFNCGGEIIEHCESGHDIGDGAECGYCPKCQMHTHYDLQSQIDAYIIRAEKLKRGE